MNTDDQVIKDFGDEWNTYEQGDIPEHELSRLFSLYFKNFPFEKLSDSATGFDMGCGSGRWAKFVAPKVNHLTCIEPSSAINSAKRLLSSELNISFLKESVYKCSISSESQDYGYSLGVLHHLSDPQLALNQCCSLLKPGAPFLLYLYYSLDSRPLLFRIIWSIADMLRVFIARMPYKLRSATTDLIALLIYLPIARICNVLNGIGINTDDVPLSFYSSLSLGTMKTDARDRFGTLVERRFTRDQIKKMCETAGMEKISFNEHPPYWVCIAYKKLK